MKHIEAKANGLLSMPGLIDCHVHFREPGLTQKGDMESESKAAKAGGVLTVCEMPNTIPPTVTVEAFADKVERAKRIKDVDIRFFFGITASEHLEELKQLYASPLWKRCSGVKLYFDHSTGNQKIDASLLDAAFELCAQLNIAVVCHCEDPETNEEVRSQMVDARNIEAHSLLRPPESEDIAIERAIALARTHGTHLHIAHLSTMQGIEQVRAAKNEELKVTCEVAPHHLFLTVDDYEVLGTLGKMNPPLRTIDHQEALWAGIVDRTVDCIATDHAPHTLKEKKGTEIAGSPLRAPSGVPGVETMLPLLLTVAAGKWPHPSGHPLFHTPHAAFFVDDIVRLCFKNPNHIFHLGKDAAPEKIQIDPEAEWTIHGKNLHSKCGWTPYEGWKVTGKVLRSDV